MAGSLLLTTEPESESMFYSRPDSAFYPLDSLTVDTSTFINGHGRLFTMEVHSTFVYQPLLKLEVTSTDDTWVFIDGALVIDLGGVHAATSGTVALDSLGLVKGSVYSLDIFHIDRTSSRPSVFQISTNIVPTYPLSLAAKPAFYLTTPKELEANFLVLGSAAIENNALALVSNSANSVGIAWSRDQLPISNGFLLSFSLDASRLIDGFAVVFQRTSNTQLGLGGKSGLGYRGIGAMALAVRIVRTSSNNAVSDDTYTAFVEGSNGITISSAVIHQFDPASGSIDFRLELNPKACLLVVYVTDVLTPSLVTKLPPSTCSGKELVPAYMGFTTATDSNPVTVSIKKISLQLVYGSQSTSIMLWKNRHCGNGKREESEQCDDGNLVDGDGCSDCQVDSMYVCDGGTHDTPDVCTLKRLIRHLVASSSLSHHGSGDNRDEAAAKQVASVDSRTDAHNLVRRLAAVCGNGVVEGKEDCDDGNTVSGGKYSFLLV
jgi:fibro-slime domain-containing protein